MMVFVLVLGVVLSLTATASAADHAGATWLFASARHSAVLLHAGKMTRRCQLRFAGRPGGDG